MADEGTDDAGTPLLTISAVQCGCCGLTRYPPQSFGCERCGAHGDDLRRVDLPAEGTLTSWATVHSHQELPTPFTVAEVLLDIGSLIRALHDTASAPVVGSRVGARSRGLADHLLFSSQERA